MYGKLPRCIGEFECLPNEMMFYQYYPLKLSGQTAPTFEERLTVFEPLINAAFCDFVGTFGLDRFVGSYAYITAKFMYQVSGCSFNQLGYHADGFMSEDINYVWCDRSPTVYNNSQFRLTQDHTVSIGEMNQQAIKENEVMFPPNTLLQLDQFVIHKVNQSTESGMRAFVKISFSNDRYDLVGNSHNYLLDYDWKMKPRGDKWNVPQSVLS